MNSITHPNFCNSTLFLKLTETPRADLPIALAGLVRIAKKYMVQDITQVIIRHISKDWPKSLEEWDTLAENQSNPMSSLEPAAAYLFALEHDVEDMLPAAFYLLTITPLTSDWDEPSEGKEGSRARWNMLVRHGELLKFVQRRDKFIRYTQHEVSLIEAWSAAREDCYCSEGCHEISALFYSRSVCHVLGRYNETENNADCLAMLKHAMSSDLHVYTGQYMSLCEWCGSERDDLVDSCRENIWDQALGAARS